MSDQSVVSLSQRRKAFRRKLRRLAGSAASYLAPAPADEGQRRGVVLPFRTRAEPLLGRFSQFERLAAAARGEEGSFGVSTQPPHASRLEIRWAGDAAAHAQHSVLGRLSMRWTKPEVRTQDSTYIRPVLTVVPGGRAERDDRVHR
jgi:hypothetical protein